MSFDPAVFPPHHISLYMLEKDWYKGQLALEPYNI